MADCEHVRDLPTVTPGPAACAECLAAGDTWVHLRICLICGHVGCCDDSKNKHATRHFETSGHPVIQSFEPGEGWRWCYVDEVSPPDGTPFRAPSTTPAAVVRTYMWIAGTYTLAASCIWGVNTMFLLAAGLDLFQVFLANAAYTVGTALFEIPTGVLADTVGRRASFLVGVLVLIITTLAYVGLFWVGGGLVAFAAVSVFVGLGFTFYSGAVEAWLVDSLDAAGHRGSLDPILARGSMVTGGAMLLGTVGGGLLGTIDLSLPYLARSAILAVSFGLAWVWMRDTGFAPRTLHLATVPREMARVVRLSFAAGLEVRPIRYLVAIRFVQWGFLMWAWYAWQPYLLQLWGDSSAIWLTGVVAALMSVATIAGNTLVDWLTRYCGRRTTLMGWAMAVQVVAAIAVGLAPGFWVAVVAFLVLIGTSGVTGPVRSSTIHRLVSRENRASVLSFDSMVSSGGSILGQAGLGWYARAFSIPGGFILGGATSILALPVIALLRRLQDPSDFIVGTSARDLGACAAQGVPSIGQISTAVE